MKIGKPFILTTVLLLGALILTAGSCDRTDIRGQGTIIIDGDVVKGQKVQMTLKVPQELEGKVYKARWMVEPEEAATVEYAENRLFGKEVVEFTDDRTATLVPKKEGELKIMVIMIYHVQTSPQLFAEKTVTVKAR